MPAKITFLCCVQAFVLERVDSKPLFLVAQSGAPIFDQQLKRSKLPLHIIALQSVLFAASLLLSAAASNYDLYHGGAAMNALVKSTAPLLCMLLRRTQTRRHWAAATASFLGIAVASDFNASGASYWNIGCAFALLFGGTLAGVLLGFTQEYYRPHSCWLEMSIGATLLCAASVGLAVPQFSLLLLAELLLYGALSFVIGREIRAYSDSINANPFLLSMMLNERRAATILIGACTSGISPRLFFGGVLALAAAHSVAD
jgi:hypothetical protein